MTQRHFVALAAALDATRPDNDAPNFDQWAADVRAVADVCAAANDRFDRDRFIAACNGR